MSALRVSVPGQPVRLIDLGPDAGRIRHTRGAVYGGVMVVAHQPKKPHVSTEQLERDREAGRRYYATHREEVRARQNAARNRCGYLMPKLKETCGRRPGHRDDHKSLRGMQEVAERRWAR